MKRKKAGKSKISAEPVEVETEAGAGTAENGLGTLYLVGTPIGNLEDITLRALRVLREADIIACEDTRQTLKLLNHFEIKTQTTSYHEHNELTKAPELILLLEEGSKIALVSDAGMPGISDPGYRLVHLCLRHKIAVVPVPGPSAVVAALAASGLPTHAFQYFGFLPVKKNQRRKELEKAKDFEGTTIIFESPRRVAETLRDVVAVLGNRPVVMAREMTKVHEEILRGKAADVLEKLKKRPEILGEVTFLIGAAGEEAVEAAHTVPLRERVKQLMEERKIVRMEAIKLAAKERHISKSQAYREYVK